MSMLKVSDYFLGSSSLFATLSELVVAGIAPESVAKAILGGYITLSGYALTETGRKLVSAVNRKKKRVAADKAGSRVSSPWRTKGGARIADAVECEIMISTCGRDAVKKAVLGGYIEPQYKLTDTGAQLLVSTNAA